MEGLTIEQKANLGEELIFFISQLRSQDECLGFIEGYKAAITKKKIVDSSTIETVFVDAMNNDEAPNVFAKKIISLFN